ncbi:hypothetical protein [Facklamia hominis]|uniref:Uncharacterized protein n=1 Tax=Facklamia hominis TaxID=178214 RepID=A0AAJ1V5C7_9LACT|nr:hypothetical protein [Facklamia hominis]MDK7186874.1 hypothetical protein [Facklamia hominis]
MKKEELINAFMEFVGEKFPELIEEKTEEAFNDGDTYYCIFSDGDIVDHCWKDLLIHKDRLSIGNVFKTEEEAKFAVEKLKVLHELELLGRAFDGVYSNYLIVFDCYNEEVSIDYKSNRNPCFFNCFFNSEEEAQQAINNIGEDRIKKYLFGVED